MKKDIRSFGYDELKTEMEHLGEKAFRSKQVYEWLHVKLADRFDEMTNLSLKLRERLEEEYIIMPVQMEERQISKLDGTNKFLFRLQDGNMIEPSGRQHDRKRSHEVQARQFRVHFIPGGLPDGLRLLRIHHRRPEAEPDPVGDARADLSDPEDHRGAGIQCGDHGDGRAARQLR